MVPSFSLDCRKLTSIFSCLPSRVTLRKLGRQWLLAVVIQYTDMYKAVLPKRA